MTKNSRLEIISDMSEGSAGRFQKGFDRQAHNQTLGIDKEQLKRNQAKILEKLNKNKTNPSLLSRARNLVLAGLGVAASAGAVDVAVGDPAGIGSVIDSGENIAADQVKVAGQAGVDTITNYPSAEVKAYNDAVDKRLDGQEPLREGEQLFDRIKIVAAANNFEDLQEMQQTKVRVPVYAVPWSVLGLGEPIGWANQGEKFNGKVISVPDLIRPDSVQQKSSYKYGEVAYYNQEEGGNNITGERVWIAGPNGASYPPEDLNPKDRPENY